MVSLSSDRTHSGGYFGFSDDYAPTNAPHTDDDDLIVDHIELVAEPELTHKPMRTPCAIILANIIYIALGLSAYLLPFLCGGKRGCGEDPLSLIMYIHGGMWFMLFFLDRYLQHSHDESRLNGYLSFYRQTQNIRRMPIFINSCGNAVLVIVIKVLDSHCNFIGNCKFLSKTRYIQILISIECIVAIAVLVVYLVYTLRFNYLKALPDVTQTDLTTSFESSYLSSDLGYRNDDDYFYQVMEKQSDMIRFLQQHTEALAKRNLKLTEEVNKLKRLRQNDSIQ